MTRSLVASSISSGTDWPWQRKESGFCVRAASEKTAAAEVVSSMRVKISLPGLNSSKGGERKRSSDLGRRVANNPIITVSDVKPSRPGMEVMSVTNAAAAQVDDEVVLLLRVSERPQPGVDPPEDALTLDLTVSDPRVQQLGEGYRSDDVVSFAYLDMASSPERVVDVYLPRALIGLDLSDPARIRFHHPPRSLRPA